MNKSAPAGKRDNVVIKNEAVSTPYAAHPSLKKMCEDEHTIECFFESIASCRPRHLEKECKEKKALMARPPPCHDLHIKH